MSATHSGELKTVEKSSPEFDSYLWGDFSASERALPVRTLNANTKSESVTFRIVPATQISRPALIPFLLQSFKIRNFILVLFPLFWILSKNLSAGTLIDPISAVISTLGILFAFIALGLKNDVADHFKGVDRILTDRGSRAIQKGWRTARQIQRYAWIFLGAALLCAGLVVVAWPQAGLILGLSLLFALWSYAGGGGVPLFFLLGPLLTLGYQISLGANPDGEALVMGILWGWLVLYLRHLKNFLHIIPSSQAGLRTIMNRLGFDHARRGIALWWLGFLILNLGYQIRIDQTVWGWIIFALLIMPSVWFLFLLKRLSSPAGSRLLKVYKVGRGLFAWTVVLWTLESFWILWTS